MTLAADHSRTPTPVQPFYNNDILHGAWTFTAGAVHTLVRLHGRIVAFERYFAVITRGEEMTSARVSACAADNSRSTM